MWADLRGVEATEEVLEGGGGGVVDPVQKCQHVGREAVDDRHPDLGRTGNGGGGAVGVCEVWKSGGMV